MYNSYSNKTVDKGYSMKMNVDLNEYLRTRIAHCNKRISTYPEKLDMEKDSCHGGWAKGYWEGRMSALEDIYDLLAQRID